MSKRKSALTKERKFCGGRLHILENKSSLQPVVRLMMYGFGDVENPRADTVDLVDEMVTDYITEVVGSMLANEGI